MSMFCVFFIMWPCLWMFVFYFNSAERWIKLYIYINPDWAQKLISSSMSRHPSTRNISSKSMHAFLSNLANRQTDKHRGQKHVPPPLSEVKNHDPSVPDGINRLPKNLPFCYSARASDRQKDLLGPTTAVFLSTDFVGIKLKWARRCPTTTVAAEINNFDETRASSAATCRQLNVLEQAAFQWRHEYHRCYSAQGRWTRGHVINHYMCEPKHDINIHCVPKKRDSHNLEYLESSKSVKVSICDILMTLAIKCIHNLQPHLSYVSTLPDITQKRKTYVVFLSVVWVALKRTGFGVYEVTVTVSRLCG